METVEDIVIVGAGIAGLTTALGLHRMGLRSLVLESSESLRVTGFALSTWANAWKALDAVGIGDILREEHVELEGLTVTSTVSGLSSSLMSFKAEKHEVRALRRKLLQETLCKDLPPGTIRFSSKLVSIEEAGNLKLLHLADGSTLKTKVLIGCDGVNSIVAKWLGLETPVFSKRWAIRGIAEYLGGHGLESNFFQFFGNGSRCGMIPCDENTVYWFFTWTPSSQEKDIHDKPAAALKQFVLSNLGKAPESLVNAIESTDLKSIVASQLRFRKPWKVLWGNITKGNVCVAGDALHPMTPDIGQGGCSALEDGVVLARCLAEALLEETRKESMKVKEEEEEEECIRIKKGLEKFAKERKWRSFELISTAYVVGFLQQSDGKLLTFIRDKLLSTFLAGMLLKRAAYDCGKLKIS
ncbi:monooxygenase 2-like [Macadamia integrifolia]|uniref:monooxygenase 2-like n=1 Tax=Macadamia integrifolia TaxID=60698 RepID=UPI001C52F94A|nr:monooxygenase 2-like [Macadamia integrifolia]